MRIMIYLVTFPLEQCDGRAAPILDREYSVGFTYHNLPSDILALRNVKCFRCLVTESIKDSYMPSVVSLTPNIKCVWMENISWKNLSVLKGL